MKERKRLVVALGGNALGNSAEEQLSLVKKTAFAIADIVDAGYEVIVGHGNGPQVGIINLAMEVSASSDANTPSMPFPECGAMSQGYIGYHLQQSIRNELKLRNVNKNVVSLITQVVVDKDDPAFEHPTKPIGMFYTKEEADKISHDKGYKFVEDAGRGYRRVVPSPQPQKIIELDLIDQLVDAENIVITVGGGGVPVTEIADELTGVPAVIDKDKSCAKLATDLKADALLILTAVDSVYINYNKDNQQKISKMSESEAIVYAKEGQFAKGSMLPKIEACLEFIKGNPCGSAVITSLEKAKDALEGTAGTVIYKTEKVVS